MFPPVRWGVIGVARIATRRVIPAMQQSPATPVMAIASRELEKAQTAAADLGIPKAYGSYEELLADPDIDAVYIPLPNHLHVPWSIRAADAGKHVLCEKPISLSVGQVKQLIAVRDRRKVRIGEAFMVHAHPQWLRVRDLVRSGRIGELRAASGSFSYFNTDPTNIRNVEEWGGGALMDIGCYPIHTTRMVLGEEPSRVFGFVGRDPLMRVDRLTSAILDYPSMQVVFQCSMQMVPYQRMQFFGTKGRIEVVIPFNALNDQPSRIIIDDGGDLQGATLSTEEIGICDQYTLQGQAFSRAIREGTPVPVELEDSLHNMATIEAIFRSGKSGSWEPVTLG
ncbi:MAG: Gfo/Idh/MocA family oxidoreductase [Acidobacteria bacterium]|nr:Gfo/Idh/MocA family oxidoreductase [Acidobacteriota bacterium]